MIGDSTSKYKETTPSKNDGGKAGYGRDGGGFGAEGQGAKMRQVKIVLTRESDLFPRPSPLGTDPQSHRKTKGRISFQV